jgi:hypothetical protein
MNTRPCKNCQRPIFTDGEDFWKWDPESELYRIVDFKGDFYPLESHPAISEQRLLVSLKNGMQLATEADILWRTVNMILTGLTQIEHSNFN